MSYKQNKLGQVVEFLSETPEIVKFCNIGGGLMRSLKPEDFHREYDMDWVECWQQIHIGADWLDGAIKAWGTGRNWNGWAVPYFELTEAMELLKSMPYLKWVPEQEWFEHSDAYKEGETIIFKSQLIEVDGRAITVYPIGDNWCWQHMDEPKSKILSPKEALVLLETACRHATDSALFDILAGYIHPDTINQFCDAVTELGKNSKKDSDQDLNGAEIAFKNVVKT